MLASPNAGKLREIDALLEPYGKEVVSAGELGLPEPEETGQSFAENAEIKARAAAGASGLPALADDSGLAVASLGGAPGIYSARWAGPEKNFQAAMRRVHEALADDLDRSAAFVWRWPGRTARWCMSRDGWTEPSSGRRAARAASATTPFFFPPSTAGPSGRCHPTRSRRSAIAPAPSGG